MYDITIIVPTYNEIETITSTIRLIDNILRTSQINGEILVMDDNSIDGTINKLKLHCKNKRSGIISIGSWWIRGGAILYLSCY